MWHLLQSEVAPTARLAATGLDPTGFLVSAYPRGGLWATYGLFLALCMLVGYRAKNGDYFWSIIFCLVAVMWFWRWWRVNRIVRDVESQVLRELRSGHFDPHTLRERLWRLEGYGFRPHSNVYALFRIDKRLRSSRAPES